MLSAKNLKEMSKKALALMNEETNKTRLAEMQKHFANRFHDDGFFGRIEELASVANGSRKKAVSKQGQKDGYFHAVRHDADGNKHFGNYAFERKTNGGRIGRFFDMEDTRYIVYSIEVHNKLSDFSCPPILVRKDTFYCALKACKAIKSTNGKKPENAIQVSSRKLWEFCRQYAERFGTFNPEELQYIGLLPTPDDLDFPENW